MALKELSYTEGAMALVNGMGRLTVLRPALAEPPLQALYTLLGQLLERDALSAADSYHALCHALLTGGYRRASGDLFRDFLLWMLLERQNDFAAQAAQNEWDEPMCAAMRADLKQLTPFFELNSITLKRWIGECYREQRQKPRQQKDNIAMISSAVWGGGTLRPLPPISSGGPAAHAAQNAAHAAQPGPGTHTPVPRALDENDLPSWRYQNEALPEGQLFVADTALEELYHRLDISPDRGVLLDDIWSFHAAYGSGSFIRDRLFLVTPPGVEAPGASTSGTGTPGSSGKGPRVLADILRAVPAAQLPAEDAYSYYEPQREQCLRNAIRFMRGEAVQNMLITGGPGVGKTMQVSSLCRELPELRLICCPPGGYAALAALIPALTRQPLRFCLFLDDFDASDPQWPALKAALAPAGVQPENLLLAAAAQRPESAFFPLRIHLPPPQLKEFVELVQALLLREGRDADFDSIQNACIDYAAALGNSPGGESPLSFRAAEIIADQFHFD